MMCNPFDIPCLCDDRINMMMCKPCDIPCLCDDRINTMMCKPCDIPCLCRQPWSHSSTHHPLWQSSLLTRNAWEEPWRRMSRSEKHHESWLTVKKRKKRKKWNRTKEENEEKPQPSSLRETNISPGNSDAMLHVTLLTFLTGDTRVALLTKLTHENGSDSMCTC